MMTEHANKRRQQRGVPLVVIDLLLKFGARERDGHGCEVIYFDRRARKQVQSYMGGAIGKLSERLDTYAVVAEDRVVTVGTRFKHINHA